MRVRRAFLLVLGPSAVLFAIVLGAGAGAGCSSDGTSAFVAGDASTLDARKDGTAADATQNDGASFGDADIDSGLADADSPCLGDVLFPVGGGDAGIDCDASNGCSVQCADILAHYRPAVAQAATQCILALPSCAGDGILDVPACVDKAIAKACSSSTASEYCAPINEACNVDASDSGAIVTQKGCEMFANGLTDAGREALRACITNGGASSCSSNAATCFDDIRR